MALHHQHQQKNRAQDKRERSLSPEVDENLIAGRNAVRELLAGGRDVNKIYVSRGEHEGSIHQLIREAKERRIPVVEVERTKLDQMSGGARHQGIVAIAAERNYATVDDMLRLAEERGEKPLLVIADGILDPQNLGALIRVAECAGAHGIILPKRRAAALTSLVAKASAGAIEYLPIARVTNLTATIGELKEKGLWIYAADMDGTPYDKTELTGPAALVLGSEGEGISRLVRESCDFVVSIPLDGRVNSMNVTNAVAVLLCEAARQRNGGKG
jgi:23S rRNA (guanosine2251-2'-O)-methyltransferase